MNKNQDVLNLKNIIVKDVFLRFQKISKIDVKKEKEDEIKWIMDFRRVSLTANFLEIYVNIFFEIYKDKKDFQVCGLESASIPLLAAIVLESKKRNLNINGLFIRKGRKKHDLMKNIEGVDNGLPVILIDDIMNSGSSIVKQIETLNAENIKVTDVFTVLRFRNKEFYDFIKEKGITIETLFELNDFSETLQIENLKTKNNEKLTPIKVEGLWKFKSEGANFKYVVPKSAPVIHNDKILFGTDSGVFYCLNKTTGETVWSYRIFQKADGKAIFSSPVIHRDTVFFGAYDGNFYALDINSGKKKWIYLDADWIGSSPSISPEHSLVYIGLEYGLIGKKGGLAAIDIESGDEVWKDTHKGLTHGSPYYSKKSNIVICGSNDGFVRIYKAKNGEKIKEYNCGSEVKYSFSESEDGKFICFGDMQGNCYLINTKTFEFEILFKANFGIYSNPVFHKDFVVITSLDKYIYCYNYIKKELQWKKQTLGRIFSTPMFFNGFVYTGSNDGRLYKIDIDTGDSQGYIQLSERIVNKILIEKISNSENLIYIPTIANEIYCIKEFI